MAKKESLDSWWDFKFSETELDPAAIIFDSKQAVPGCFDADGEYRYRRGVGYYRRPVNCGGRVRLTIGALGLRGKVYWDAKLLGTTPRAYSRESWTFDAGAEDKHELLIAVDNRYDERPSSLFRRDYDFYGYGGIYRSVTLERLPENFIESVQVIPESLTEGTVRINVETASAPLKVAFDGGAWTEYTPVLRVPEFKLWSPTQPHLHRVTIDNGSDRVEVKFGLRQVSVIDGRFCLNGKPLKLFGFNRHDAYPGLGAAVPPEKLREDLRLIKEAGFNIIRGSHYPQSEEMLELCDQFGLLVWEESLGWGNPAEALTDPVFIAEQCEQTRMMVRKSINHPSVVIWGFLNEAETKDVRARQLVASLVEAIRAEDDSRLIAYATMFREKDVCMDLADIAAYNTYPAWGNPVKMFFDPAEEEKDLAFLESVTPSEKPFIISEIGAGALLGTHSRRRWSEEFQAELLACVFDYVRKNPRCSGVMVWQFCDTEIDNNIRVFERPRGFNNKGVLDEYRRPKLAWTKLKELLKPPVKPVSKTPCNQPKPDMVQVF